MATIREKERQEKQQWLKAFGDHVRKLRLKKGLSVSEFGRQLFMDQPNVTRLEKGRVNPSVYLVKQICDVLELRNIEDFWDGFKVK